MVELVIGIVGGALFSWLISYLYYKKSSVQIPECGSWGQTPKLIITLIGLVVFYSQLR
jgi:hypothetical protein